MNVVPIYSLASNQVEALKLIGQKLYSLTVYSSEGAETQVFFDEVIEDVMVDGGTVHVFMGVRSFYTRTGELRLRG